MGITKDYLRYVHSGSCGCVGSANGEICAIDATTCAVTACENVSFYNMRTNEKVHELSESTKEATCMQLSADKRWQAVGYADGVIRLFDRKAAEQSCVIFSGHKKAVSSLAFSDDGLTLASGGKDCAVILWDIVSESGLFRLSGHKGPVTRLAFARDDQFLISSSKDCLVKFWSLRSQSCFYTIFDSSSEIYYFSLLWNSTIMVVATAEAELLVYELIWLEDGKIALLEKAFGLMSNNTVLLLKITCDLNSNTVVFDCVSTLDQYGHRSDIRGLSVSSSNNAIVSGGGNELMIWNTHSLRPVASLQNEAMLDVTAVVFTQGDGHVVAATKTGELFLWDVAGCELLESRKGHEGTIWRVMHSPDGKQLLSVSSDKRAKFWAYEVVAEGTRKRLTLRESRILEVPDEALCCAFSPDGKFVIIGLLDNTAAVYFFDTLKFFISLYGHSLPVTCVTVSPDSKLVVTGSADKSIKIWGLDFGDCHKSFHAHDDVVSAVMFSPSDEMLVWSAGRDGKIKQWDAQKMCQVQVLDRHSAEVRALAQSDSGNLLFSASHDRSLRCWELTEELIVVEEEEEMEREKVYEARLIDEEDVVSGEAVDAEAGLATVKNSQSIVSAENIIEAVDIVRNEKVQLRENVEHKPHPLFAAYNSKSYDHFIVDVIARCRPSNLERSLLMVPLSYVSDILSALSECVQKRYKVEFAVRIAIFLIRIHQNYIINSAEMLPVLEKISTEMPKGIADVRDITGFNLAALELLQLELEEAQNVKLFADVSEVANKQKKKNKARKAVIKT
ncbi:WD domain, G-beta repeat protein [Ostertagia ostertagi]